LLLDVVRFGAAATVAIGHVTQSHFSQGWRDLTTHGVEAVGIFFVLSGFVIRYVTRLKYSRIGEYWIDRASRIYSVVLPAILFTVLADWIASHANPGYFYAHWGQYMDHPVRRLVQNLLFTSQFWSRDTALFSNSPFWSLSYECLYYAIYGCAFYLRGWLRWITVASLVALGGAHIALLFPLWILGCILYDVYARLTARKCGWRTHLGFAVAAVLGFVLWRPAVSAIFSLKYGIARIILAHHHTPPNLHWMLDYYRAGIPAAFLMLWLLVAMHGMRLEMRSRWAYSVRVLAEATFPLYLFHFPFYVLIACTIPYNHANPVAKIGMLLAAVALGVLLAFPTNWLKDAMRNNLRAWLIPDDVMPESRSAETVESWPSISAAS
jgi:peptidoglycan/LPS O-acetylase OafA/YrhL